MGKNRFNLYIEMKNNDLYKIPMEGTKDQAREYVKDLRRKTDIIIDVPGDPVILSGSLIKRIYFE